MHVLALILLQEIFCVGSIERNQTFVHNDHIKVVKCAYFIIRNVFVIYRLVKQLSQSVIIQIACGLRHVLALSQGLLKT